jgi:hypothetical protein
MQLTSGMRLKSTVSSTEVIIVRPPAEPVELTCGGSTMVDLNDASDDAGSRAAPEGETLLGKRYHDEQSGLELLCTKGGAGLLECDGRPLEFKQAAALPSSD